MNHHPSKQSFALLLNAGATRFCAESNRGVDRLTAGKNGFLSVVLSDCDPLSLAGEGGQNAAQSFFRRVFSLFFINQRLVLYQRSCSVGAQKAKSASSIMGGAM